MGVGFFLGILQTGNSAGSARPLLASSLGSDPESGRLLAAPRSWDPPPNPRGEPAARARPAAGPGLSPQHTRSLGSGGLPAHSPRLSYSPNSEKVRPPLLRRSETPRTDVPVRDWREGRGNGQAPPPREAAELPVASPTANGDWPQRQMTRKYVTGGAAHWVWGGVKGRLSGRPLLVSGDQVDARGSSCTQVIVPLRGVAWSVYVDSSPPLGWVILTQTKVQNK